jgi:hypothetical protein
LPLEFLVPLLFLLLLLLLVLTYSRLVWSFVLTSATLWAYMALNEVNRELEDPFFNPPVHRYIIGGISTVSLKYGSTVIL